VTFPFLPPKLSSEGHPEDVAGAHLQFAFSSSATVPSCFKMI